jgi:hypothetical protein
MGLCFEWDEEKAKMNSVEADPAMLPEYDFGTGVRGKYAERYAAESNIVVLSADVADVFPNSESVNDALRVLANLIRQQSEKVSA